MPNRSVLLAALLGLSIAPLQASGLRAQQGISQQPRARGVDVSGRVVDRSSGVPLVSARIELVPADTARVEAPVAVTDSVGRFGILQVPLGSYELRGQALGFADLRYAVSLSQEGATELLIEMVPAALEMDPIVVTVSRLEWLAQQGFYERRARALGYTLTREEIAARNPYLVSDIFYGIPGADVISERTGQRPAFVLLRGRCVPQVVLDGAPFSSPVPIDQVLAVQDLEAIEVYHGSTGPIRYSTTSCGTIMLWTRRAPADPGRPLSWTRFLTAIGIVAWFALTAW